MVIPNERLAAGILRNDTLGSDAIGLDVSVWLPLDADTDRALAALEDETGSEASVAEVTADGVRIAVGGDPVPPPQKGPGRPSCEPSASSGCAARVCWEGNPPRRRIRQGYTRRFALVMERVFAA